MDLKHLFYTIFKTFNPYTYYELTDKKFLYALKYLFFITVFSTLLMFILFIPFLFYTGNYVSSDLSHFQSINFSSSFQPKDSFNLMADPVIRVGPAQSNITNEFLLINPQTISYKRFLLFGGQVDVPLKQSTDVVSNANSPRFVTLGLIFLIPSLLFWSIIFFLIYFSILILITFILGLIFVGLFRINISVLKVLKASLYASTIFILMQLVLMPFFRLLFLPLAAYWILFLLILFVWRDKSVEIGHKPMGSKSDDIFDHKENHAGHSSGHGIESRDSYDVDEHGNIKSARGHKKIFKEENDGYVEL